MLRRVATMTLHSQYSDLLPKDSVRKRSLRCSKWQRWLFIALFVFMLTTTHG